MWIAGTNTDFDDSMIIFNTKEALHMTLPWQGARVVLAAYSVQGAERIPADEFEQLLQLGFSPALVHTGDQPSLLLLQPRPKAAPHLGYVRADPAVAPRAKPKAEPSAAFRQTEAELIRLLGAAPLDDPVEGF